MKTVFDRSTGTLINDVIDALLATYSTYWAAFLNAETRCFAMDGDLMPPNVEDIVETAFKRCPKITADMQKAIVFFLYQRCGFEWDFELEPEYKICLEIFVETCRAKATPEQLTEPKMPQDYGCECKIIPITTQKPDLPLDEKTPDILIKRRPVQYFAAINGRNYQQIAAFTEAAARNRASELLGKVDSFYQVFPSDVDYSAYPDIQAKKDIALGGAGGMAA